MDIGYWISAIGYRLLDIGYWLSAIGYRLLDIGYWISLLDIGYWGLDMGLWSYGNVEAGLFLFVLHVDTSSALLVKKDLT